MANSVNPDHMLHFAASDLGLHCLFRPVCPNFIGEYGNLLSASVLPIIETSDADVSETEEGGLAAIAEGDEASRSNIVDIGKTDVHSSICSVATIFVAHHIQAKGLTLCHEQQGLTLCHEQQGLTLCHEQQGLTLCHEQQSLTLCYEQQSLWQDCAVIYVLTVSVL